MIVKVKKQNQDGIVRLESSGEIKEIIINEDFLNPGEAGVHLCFRGKSSSGIIELTPEEAHEISKTIAPKVKLLKDPKIMKFEK